MSSLQELLDEIAAGGTGEVHERAAAHARAHPHVVVIAPRVRDGRPIAATVRRLVRRSVRVTVVSTEAGLRGLSADLVVVVHREHLRPLAESSIGPVIAGRNGLVVDVVLR